MSRLLVFCPTRGRPTSAWESYRSFTDTFRGDSKMLYVIDDDEDPALYDGLPIRIVRKSGSMNKALQLAVDAINLEDATITYYGFVGDDHRFRTRGWDRRIMEVLDDQGGGIAYGNDLNRDDIPTQVFISSSIVKALGWFGLRRAKHLYLDNAWRVLGDGADCLYYLPDIIIEHIHPSYGKGKWDENYLRVNSPEMYSHDQAVFSDWLETAAELDVATVRKVLGK